MKYKKNDIIHCKDGRLYKIARRKNDRYLCYPIIQFQDDVKYFRNFSVDNIVGLYGKADKNGFVVELYEPKKEEK